MTVKTDCVKTNVIKKSSGRKRQCFIGLIATLGMFNCGLHYGWSTSALPKILSEEYKYDISNGEASYIATIGFIGTILGGLLSSYVLDRIGRKKSTILVSIPQAIGFICIIFCDYSKILLYIARLLGGIFEGSITFLCPIYISEIAEPEIRGILSILITIALVLGVMFINIVGFYLSLSRGAIVFTLFPIALIILFSKLPETPYYCLMKKRTKEAEESLCYLLNKADVTDELKQLNHDVNRQMSESGTFMDLYRIKSNRKACFIVILAIWFQEFTGSTAFSYYSQLLLSEAIPSVTPVLSSSLLFLAQLIMAVLSSFFVDKYGRKPLMLVSSISCFIVLLTQAIFFTIRDFTDINVSNLEFIPLVMMMLFMVTYYIGMASICNILMGELFSASAKAKVIIVLSFVFAVTAVISTKVYQVTADNIGLAVPFYIFGSFTLVCVLYVIFLLPETKGKTLEEIQQELKGNRKSKLDISL